MVCKLARAMQARWRVAPPTTTTSRRSVDLRRVVASLPDRVGVLPTTVTRQVSAAAALLALGAATGCGSSTPPVTHAQFVSQVNAVCRAAGNPYSAARPSEPTAFLAFLQAQLPMQDKGLAALKKLRPPAAESDAWSGQILKPEQLQLDDTKAAVARLQAAIQSNGPTQPLIVVRQTVNRLDARGSGINRYWTANGMTDCVDSSL